MIQDPYLSSADIEAPSTAPIPHYHGNVVRQLLITAVILMLVGAPFYAGSLKIQLPFLVVGALLLASVAAIANPHKRWVFIAGAGAAGIGFAVYEMWSLYQYTESTWMQTVLRQIIALIFLVAFYFSMKTIRAFTLHKIGKHDEVGEFDDTPHSQPEQILAFSSKRPDQFLPWFFKNGARSRKEGEAPPSEEGSRMSPKKTGDNYPHEQM